LAEVLRGNWKSPAELKEQFRSASIVSTDRVVFNIKGNDYRLVAAVDYTRGTIYIKWLGTHAEYDRIDVKTVEYMESRYDDPTDSQ
jgi:mRNA interferase HigB